MPNTLAHLAVHSVATRGVIRDAELAWVYAGCVIPDLPWIFQRVAQVLLPQIDVYDLRLYAANQASLCLSLVLSAGVAALSVAWRRAFVILGMGSLFHLLLDACQIKWGNGVGLFVPFDWSLFRFDWFWPESIPTYLLTLGGLAYFFMKLRDATTLAPQLTTDARRWSLGALLITVYFVLPAVWVPQAFAANNHYVATLSVDVERVGKDLELDRAVFRYDSGHPALVTFAGETLEVVGMDLRQDQVVSVRGRFLTPHSLEIHQYHVHRAGLRNFASYVGLGLVAGLWLAVVLGKLGNASRSVAHNE